MEVNIQDNKSVNDIKSILRKQGFIIEDTEIEVDDILTNTIPVKAQLALLQDFKLSIKKDGKKIEGNKKFFTEPLRDLRIRVKRIIENLQN